MYTQNRANNFSATAEFLIQDNSIELTPMKYNIVEYTTPTSTLSPDEVQRQGQRGTLPGDTIDKEQSTILRFILDEDLEVYFNLLDIQEMNAGKGYSQDSLILNIQNNYRKNIALGTYTNAWIGTIYPLRYSVQEQETTVYVEVTLNFLTFNLEKVL